MGNLMKFEQNLFKIKYYLNLMLIILLFTLLRNYKLLLNEENFMRTTSDDQLNQTQLVVYIYFGVQCIIILMILSGISHLDIFTNVSNITFVMINVITLTFFLL